MSALEELAQEQPEIGLMMHLINHYATDATRAEISAHCPFVDEGAPAVCSTCRVPFPCEVIGRYRAGVAS